MTSINNYLTSFEDNLNGLIHDDIQSYISDYKKINIYNQNIEIPAQKIWIETPKLRTTSKLFLSNKQKQYGLLWLLLYNLDSEIGKFKSFIEKLEDKIFDLVEGMTDKELTFKSSIRHSESYYPTFSIQLPYVKKNNEIEFLFDIYDSNNKKVSHEKIISGSFIKAFIELNDIWMSETEFGLNWKVLQMKIYPEFNFQKCLFANDSIEFIDDKKYKNEIIIPPTPPPSPSPHKQKHKNDNLKFVPTVGELLSMKNNLKKIKENCSEESKIGNLEDTQKKFIKKKKKKIIKK